MIRALLQHVVGLIQCILGLLQHVVGQGITLIGLHSAKLWHFYDNVLVCFLQ